MNSKTGRETVETCTANKIERGILKQGDKTYPLYDGLNLIGRDSKATVYVQNVSIDSQHAIITILSETGQYISDFKSSHGTSLNNQPLTPFKLYNLQDGMSIKFGDIQMTYIKNDSAEQDVDDEDATQLFDEPRQDDIHDAPTQYMAFDMSDCANNKEGDIHELPTQVFDFSNGDVCGTSKTCSAISSPGIREKAGKLADVNELPMSENCPSSSISNGASTGILGDPHELPTQKLPMSKNYPSTSTSNGASTGNLGDLHELPTQKLPMSKNYPSTSTSNGASTGILGDLHELPTQKLPMSKNCPSTSTSNGASTGNLGDLHELPTQVFEFEDGYLCDIPKNCWVSTPVSKVKTGNSTEGVHELPTQVFPIDNHAHGDVSKTGSLLSVSSTKSRDVTTSRRDLADEDDSSSDSVDFMTMQKAADTQCVPKESVPEETDDHAQCSQVKPVKKRSKNPLDSDDEPANKKSPEADDSSTDVEESHDAPSKKIMDRQETDKKSDSSNSNRSDNFVSQVHPVRKHSKNPLDSDTDIEDVDEPDQMMSQVHPVKRNSKNPLDSDTDIEDLHEPGKSVEVANTLAQKSCDETLPASGLNTSKAQSEVQGSKNSPDSDTNSDGDTTDVEDLNDTLKALAASRNVSDPTSDVDKSSDLITKDPLLAGSSKRRSKYDLSDSETEHNEMDDSDIIPCTLEPAAGKNKDIEIADSFQEDSFSFRLELSEVIPLVSQTNDAKNAGNQATSTNVLLNETSKKDISKSESMSVEGIVVNQATSSGLSSNQQQIDAVAANDLSKTASQKSSEETEKFATVARKDPESNQSTEEYVKNVDQLKDQLIKKAMEIDKQDLAQPAVISTSVNTPSCSGKSLARPSKSDVTVDESRQEHDYAKLKSTQELTDDNEIICIEESQPPEAGLEKSSELGNLGKNSETDGKLLQTRHVFAQPSLPGALSSKKVPLTTPEEKQPEHEDVEDKLHDLFASQRDFSCSQLVNILADGGVSPRPMVTTCANQSPNVKLNKLASGGVGKKLSFGSKDDKENNEDSNAPIDASMGEIEKTSAVDRLKISGKTSSATTSGANKRNDTSSPKPGTSKAPDEPDVEDQLDMMFASQQVKFTEHDLVNILNTTVEEPNHEYHEKSAIPPKTASSITGNEGLDLANKADEPAVNGNGAAGDPAITKSKKSGRKEDQESSPLRIDSSTPKVQANTSSSAKPKENKQLGEAACEVTPPVDKNVAKLSKNVKSLSRDNSPARVRKPTLKVRENASNLGQTSSSSPRESDSTYVTRTESERTKLTSRNVTKLSENSRNSSRDSSPSGTRNATSKTDEKKKNPEQSGSSSKKQESNTNQKQPDEDQAKSNSPVEESDSSSSKRKRESKANEKQANENQVRPKRDLKNEDRADSPLEASSSSSPSKKLESKTNEQPVNENKGKSKGTSKKKDQDDSPVEDINSSSSSRKPGSGGSSQDKRREDSPVEASNTSSSSKKPESKDNEKRANENQVRSRGNQKSKDGDDSPVEVSNSKATNESEENENQKKASSKNNLGKGKSKQNNSSNGSQNSTTTSQERNKEADETSVANETKQKIPTSSVGVTVKQSKRNMDLEVLDNPTSSKLPTKQQQNIDLTNSDSNDDSIIMDDNKRTVLKGKSKDSESIVAGSSKTISATSAVGIPKNMANTVDKNEHLEEIKKVISESIRDVQQKEASSSKKKSSAATLKKPSRSDDVAKTPVQAKADSKVLTRTRSGDIENNSPSTTPVKRSTRSTTNVTPIINLIANETRASTRSSTRTRDRLELLELLDRKTKTEDFGSGKLNDEDFEGPSPPKKRCLSDSKEEEPPFVDRKDEKTAEVDSKGDSQKKNQKEPPTATKASSENSAQSTAVGDPAVDLFGIRARNSTLKPINLVAPSPHEDESSQDSAKSEISVKSTTSTRSNSTASHTKKSKTVRKTRGSSFIIDLVDDDMKITVPQNRTRTSSITVAKAPTVTVEALEVTASTSKGRMSTRSKPIGISKQETSILSPLPEDKVRELPSSTSSSSSDLPSTSSILTTTTTTIKPAPRGRKLSANSRRLRALQDEQEENIGRKVEEEEDSGMKNKAPAKRPHQQNKDKEEPDEVVVLTSKRRKKDSVSSNEGASSSNASSRMINTPSTPERSRRKLKPKVVFTMMDNPELESLIRQLGGSVVDSVECCTVLVTEHVKRTCKLLSAVGQAKPICSPKWLTECRKASTFLDPWDHVLVDKEAEKKWNFSLLESLQRSAAKKLMAGYTFHLVVNVATDVLKGAIESCGGKVVSKIVGKIDPQKYFIVASPENKAKYSRVVKTHPGLRVIEPEAIFDGTLRQELHFEDHLLPV